MARTPQSRPNRAEAAEKRAEAYRLKLRGLSDRAIAAELGVSHTTIQNWTKQEADAVVLPLAEELRKVQLERLGEMRQAALQVLEREHVTVSHGRVVREGQPVLDFDDEGNQIAVIAPGQGEPILDDGPVLAAIDRLLKIEERIAKLLGLDAPTRAEVEARVEPRPAELQAMINRAREQVAEDEAFLQEGPP